MSSPPSAWRRRAALLLTEPTFHFFIVGALLFLAYRLIAGNPRVIVVTPSVRADVARRFRDHHEGRQPSSSELESELRGWEREEALYREALRDGLDRNDGTIRTILADRARAGAALATPKREPSEADLDAWLASHRSLYETPRRYDYETVSFPKAQPSAPEQREKYEQAAKEGADPRTLGRSIMGGNQTAEEMKGSVVPALAEQIQSLPVGPWQRFESDDALLLVRVNAVAGGLPDADELHRRLLADWLYAEKKEAADRAVQVLVDRYRVEERP